MDSLAHFEAEISLRLVNPTFIIVLKPQTATQNLAMLAKALAALKFTCKMRKEAFELLLSTHLIQGQIHLICRPLTSKIIIITDNHVQLYFCLIKIITRSLNLRL